MILALLVSWRRRNCGRNLYIHFIKFVRTITWPVQKLDDHFAVLSVERAHATKSHLLVAHSDLCQCQYLHGNERVLMM